MSSSDLWGEKNQREIYINEGNHTRYYVPSSVKTLMETLKKNENYILKSSKFVLFDHEVDAWEITVASTYGETLFIIKVCNDGFKIEKVVRNEVYPIFECISDDELTHGFVFYMINFWGQYFSLPNYVEVSNDMSLEEATQSLQSSLKELKYSYFNTPKGVTLRQINDELYSFEIQIQDEIKSEVDTLDIIAKTAYFLSRDIHDFYTLFYQMELDEKYEDECKKFFLYDDLYRVPSIYFFRSQKLVKLRKDK